MPKLVAEVSQGRFPPPLWIRVPRRGVVIVRIVAQLRAQNKGFRKIDTHVIEKKKPPESNSGGITRRRGRDSNPGSGVAPITT